MKSKVRLTNENGTPVNKRELATANSSEIEVTVNARETTTQAVEAELNNPR